MFVLFYFVCAAIAQTVFAADTAPNDRRSGYDFMGRETRAMQDDDTANPGMLWVLDGEALWARKDGEAGKSCADCHGEAATSMKGVAARYPAFDASHGAPVDLAGRVNLCRREQQKATLLPFESKELLALTAFIARQSKGAPIAVKDDAQTRSFIDAGRQLFEQRQGQLNFSCAQCHDDNWNQKLAGAPITQAHPTGYPLYRLEWQSLGSLQRRMRSCMLGMRAEPYAYGAPEFVALELYLKWRARGMPTEAPAVRP